MSAEHLTLNKGFRHTLRTVETGVLYVGRNLCAQGDGRVVATAVTEEYADRIIACVNACEGISDSDLAALSGTTILEKANATFDRVERIARAGTEDTVRAEREACAQILEENPTPESFKGEQYSEFCRWVADSCRRIRAR